MTVLTPILKATFAKRIVELTASDAPAMVTNTATATVIGNRLFRGDGPGIHGGSRRAGIRRGHRKGADANRLLHRVCGTLRHRPFGSEHGDQRFGFASSRDDGNRTLGPEGTV